MLAAEGAKHHRLWCQDGIKQREEDGIFLLSVNNVADLGLPGLFCTNAAHHRLTAASPDNKLIDNQLLNRRLPAPPAELDCCRLRGPLLLSSLFCMSQQLAPLRLKQQPLPCLYCCSLLGRSSRGKVD